MDFNTIFNDYQLPSKGLVYNVPVNPNITLRSMTTVEEMRRLSPTEMPYKAMADIIEGCMKEPPAVHVRDMCLGDYQYLLHKIRQVTYGSEYKMTVKCPEEKCGKVTEVVADLTTMPVMEYTPKLNDEKFITLPKSQHVIGLRLQTPLDLDMITLKAKQARKNGDNLDFNYLFTLTSFIDTVDGEKLDSIKLEDLVKKLPNYDGVFLMQKGNEYNSQIGIENDIEVTCKECGKTFHVPFRMSSQFFRPTI